MLGTFYPLFPKNNHFNEPNIQTPMNYMGIYPYAQIPPRADLAFMAGIDILWQQNTNDSFYQTPGAPVVAGNANTVVERRAGPKRAGESNTSDAAIARAMMERATVTRLDAYHSRTRAGLIEPEAAQATK